MTWDDYKDAFPAGKNIIETPTPEGPAGTPETVSVSALVERLEELDREIRGPSFGLRVPDAAHYLAEHAVIAHLPEIIAALRAATGRETQDGGEQ